MAAEKTDGIVLRVIAFSETSCIVTMMTRDFGKITLMAKGARRPKSPFEAALDVLAICRIVFLHKTSGAMSLLTEAKLERRFRSSATNLKRLYSAYYIVELLNILTDEGDSNPELFELADKTIRLIDSDQIEEDLLNLELLKFELSLLDLLGHLPMLTKCVSCGREKTTLARVHFGLNAGGILCHGCRKGQANVVSLSPGGLQYLLDLVGGQIGADEENSDNWNQTKRVPEKQKLLDCFSENGKNKNELDRGGEPKQPAHNTDAVAIIDANQEAGLEKPKTDLSEQETEKVSEPLGEIRGLINKYVTHLLGFPPKLHKYLKNI